MLSEASKEYLLEYVPGAMERVASLGLNACNPAAVVTGLEMIVIGFGITEPTGEPATDVPLDVVNNRAEAERFIAGIMGLM